LNESPPDQAAILDPIGDFEFGKQNVGGCGQLKRAGYAVF